MSVSVTKVIAKDGGTYEVDVSGATSIKARYQVVLSAPLNVAADLPTSFSDGTNSIPSIGTAHPARTGYYASKYEVTQPQGSAKNTLNVAVVYTADGSSKDDIQEDPEQPAVAVDSLVTEWGWDDGTAEKEFVEDIYGELVVNSAGDPFDSVPTVSVPAPTFTKAMKFGGRRVYFKYNCTVNESAVQIGNVTFPAYTLLCTVSEKANIGDAVYPWTYTVRLRYRTNRVKDRGASAATEIGWNVAIVDAGMREIDDDTGELKLIQTISKETGQPANITSPELLDGTGHAVARSASGAPANPYILTFGAYEAVTWPSWFYSPPGNNSTPPNT